MKESTTKQAYPGRKDITMESFKLVGIEGHHDELGNIILQIPVAPLPECHCPILTIELMDWAQDAGISETAVAAGYDAAKEAFFKAVKRMQVTEYIAEHMVSTN